MAEVRQERVNAVKDLENHEDLCKTLGFDGVFGLGRAFWRFRQDAWSTQEPGAFAGLEARGRHQGAGGRPNAAGRGRC